eukprot:jgi/Chrzof1/4077/Cz13g19110.t1
MSEQLDQQILAAQEAVTKQGDTVRSLKAGKKDGKVEQVLTTLLTSYNILPAMGVTAHVCVAQAEIDAAIQQLKELKLELEEKQKSSTLERRMFYIPSFKIYGSVAGFYDYGPPGCAIKQNITQACAGTGNERKHSVFMFVSFSMSHASVCVPSY